MAKTIRAAVFILAILGGFSIQGEAANLTFVSDLISSSAPSASVSHTFTFTVNSAVPAGGTILITPEAGDFNIPAGMDYTDIDLLVATTPGNYVDRDINSSASSTEDGVSIVTGMSGSINITLNSTAGLSVGDQVKVLAGNIATHQTTGDLRIFNPSAVGSYRIDIRTQDGADILESARAMIAIVNQVTVTSDVQNVPPVMSNGNPSGSFSHTVTAIEIWLNTDENAICKYSTSPGVSFSSMPFGFSFTDDTLHRTVVSGLNPNTSYDYYVKCIDDDLNETPSDLQISFSIRAVPPAGTVPGPIGGPEGAGGGPIVVVAPPGERYPPDKASLYFEGLAYPSGTVSILKDGVSVGTAQVGGNSKFNFTLAEVDRGIYTFGFYAMDPDNNKSDTSNLTFTVMSNTGNQVTNIKLHPTVKIASNSFDVGVPVGVSGHTIYDSSVEVVVYDRTNPSAPVFQQTIPSNNGKWSVNIATSKLPAGSYFLRARSIISASEQSAWTHYYAFGLGVGAPIESGFNGDLNGDGKVNLVDFSIMIFNWGPAGGGTPSDLNGDNTVNLTDFSILLFNWTG